MFQRIATYFIERAQRTPYSHLAHEGGAYYMKRYWLVPYRDIPEQGATGCGPVTWKRPLAKILQGLGIAIRIHHIMEPDPDRHLHDHPWWWASIVLRGWYVERLPTEANDLKATWNHSGREEWRERVRRAGSFALCCPEAAMPLRQCPGTVFGPCSLPSGKARNGAFIPRAERCITGNMTEALLSSRRNYLLTTANSREKLRSVDAYTSNKT